MRKESAKRPSVVLPGETWGLERALRHLFMPDGIAQQAFSRLATLDGTPADGAKCSLRAASEPALCRRALALAKRPFG